MSLPLHVASEPQPQCYQSSSGDGALTPLVTIPYNSNGRFTTRIRALVTDGITLGHAFNMTTEDQSATTARVGAEDDAVGNAFRRDADSIISEGKVVEGVDVGPPGLAEADSDTDEEVCDMDEDEAFAGP